MILVFESIHKVLKAEQILLNHKIKHEIIPTPKEISSDCGMSIRLEFNADTKEKIISLFQENQINVSFIEK